MIISPYVCLPNPQTGTLNFEKSPVRENSPAKEPDHSGLIGKVLDLAAAQGNEKLEVAVSQIRVQILTYISRV